MFFISLTVLIVILLLCAVVVWLFNLMSGSINSLKETARQKEASRRLLNAFIAKLSTDNETTEAMAIVSSKLCEDLDAESAGIFVPDKQAGAGCLRGVACTGYFPIFTAGDVITDTKIRENARYRTAYFNSEIVNAGDGPIGTVVETHKPILFYRESGKEPPWQLPDEVKTMMVMPLLVDGKFVGVICVVNRHHELSPFTEYDLEVFQQLSVQPALACSLVIIYAERRHQDRLKREFEVCAELQKSMLPDVPASLGPYAFATLNAPAYEVSGDFYDYVHIDDNRILAMIADAMGKGLPACLMTSMARSFVRATVERYRDMGDFLRVVNHLLFSNSDASRFLTMNILMLDMRTGSCELGCAGHTPLLIRHADGRCESLKPQGAALGMWPDDFPDLFETCTFQFEPGMSICMFTDGITEALNTAHEEYGMERLLRQWHTCSAAPGDGIREIMNSVRAFVKDEAQADDQTIFAITRNPEPEVPCSYCTT